MKMKQNAGATATRVLTALVLIPVVFALELIPGLHLGFSLFVALLAGVGIWEYFGMVRALNLKSAPVPAVGLGMLLVAGSGFIPAHASVWVMAAFVATGLFVAAFLLCVIHLLFDRQTLAGTAATVFGLVWVGGCATHLVLLHAMDKFLVLFLLVAVILSDTGAYFVGRAFGRHKLAPRVSPNKTWEGALGGIAAAALGGMVISQFFFALFPQVHWVYASVAAFVALFGQVGDLAESMLKRDAGVKDSGTLFPGHGGVLDRCDGILFAAPALFYLILILRTVF